MTIRSSLRRRLRLAAGLGALAALAGMVLPATAAVAAQHSGPVMTSQTPLPVRNGSARDLGPFNPAQTIRLAVGLKPPHMAAEQAFLRAIQDKSSPLFHHYLTTAQWTARYGPSAAAQNAVVAWARSHGLTVSHTYANRLVVDLTGPVSAVQNALGVQLNSYRLKSTTFFANNHDPVLPASLSRVVESVDGLSDLQTMFPASGGMHEPRSPVYSPGPNEAMGPHASGNGSRVKLAAAERASRRTKSNITNGNYDPTDIYSSQAYDYNALYAQGHCCNPTGLATAGPLTSIAIATFGSQQISDLTGFHTAFPYLAYNIHEIDIDGSPACCDAEGTMDSEWSTATSNSFGGFQQTSAVYLYDGANFNDSTFTDIYNRMVSDNLARVFSTSWSCTEIYGCSTATIDTRDAIFSEMAGQGWSLVAASGDRGAYDDCSHLAVSYPASDPNVVGAGGTELSLSSGPVYNGEVAWSGGPDGCSSNDGGSGGGCSSVFSAPSYQTPQACGSGSRAVPDISLNADWYHTPQSYYFGGSLGGNGGTSIVAPELAGFFAQEDSYLLAAGSICGSGASACAPMGNANFGIYSAAHSSPHNPYYDTTSGCNSNNVGTGYCAGTGYDLVTGWGSANMLQLAWGMNWRLFADDGRPSVSFSGPATSTWYRTDQTIGLSAADTGGGHTPSGVAGITYGWNAISDPTGEATPGSGNSFYSGPEFPNTTNGSLDLADEGQGCHTVNAEAWDNMGLQSGDVTDGPLCYDSVAPVITSAPVLRLQDHVGPIHSTVPVTVQWAGHDATSGIAHYTVYQSKNGGAYSQVATPTVAHFTRQLSPGNSFRFKVTATDKAGNVSGATIGKVYKLSLDQENNKAISYSSGWTRQSLSGSNGGSVEYASKAGSTATLSFSGFEVAWMTTEATNRGSASVKLGSAGAATISTHAVSTKLAHICDTVLGTVGSHKLVIKVSGTSGHPRVDIDAFIILSTT
jgi:pro-kumamolisin-like protein